MENTPVYEKLLRHAKDELVHHRKYEIPRITGKNSRPESSAVDQPILGRLLGVCRT
jgi:hypothetical protein